MDSIHPFLTQPDTIVLKNLLRETSNDASHNTDQAAIQLLLALNDATSKVFQPTVFTTWDVKTCSTTPAVISEEKSTSSSADDTKGSMFTAAGLRDTAIHPVDSPKVSSTFPQLLNATAAPLVQQLDRHLLQPYIARASGIVRRPTDVVFLTHIILYLTTSVPSAIYLYYSFSWLHAVCHWLMQAWFCGPFTLMLHNHIHNNGILAKKYAWFDKTFPYILEPLMGHTWDSYYYHHVKHHHVESNGPDDLSSTIRYQRDELKDFLMYVGRFLGFIWIELPLYFLRTGKRTVAAKCFFSEITSYMAIFLLARFDFCPTLFVFLIPLLQMRIAMMVGNWGQHAFVDEVEPDSDFRSSITLIDVPVRYSFLPSHLNHPSNAFLDQSNRFCFNDGWHTSHHLNPLRHWRDHPLAFLKAKKQYQDGRALIFHNIDYLELTYRLMRKDYDHIARCLVPIGEQKDMNQEERVDMLMSKTRRFNEEDIRSKFRKVG